VHTSCLPSSIVVWSFSPLENLVKHSAGSVRTGTVCPLQPWVADLAGKWVTVRVLSASLLLPPLWRNCALPTPGDGCTTAPLCAVWRPSSLGRVPSREFLGSGPQASQRTVNRASAARLPPVLWASCLSFPKPTHLADFNQVQTIQYSSSEDKDRKGMLQLKIAGAPEVRGPTATQKGRPEGGRVSHTWKGYIADSSPCAPK
jgi:hypothetical protein